MRFWALFIATTCLSGCKGTSDAHAEPHPSGHPTTTAHEAEPMPPKEAAARRFLVPFIPTGSEASLQPARDFLSQAMEDNARFVKSHGASHFAPFVDTQKPRVTLVACADSRVQTGAFDANPENDVFTIRNIGN